MYLMINKIKEHFEEVDGDKYIIISSENDDIMQKYQEVFDGIKVNDYRIHFWYMSKNDAIILMTNSTLKDKNGIL